MTNVLADQANDYALVLDGHFGELAELAEDEVDVGGVVDGEGDADLAGGDHIDGGFVAVEHFEDAAQETVRHQHAGGVNVDRGDAALAGDRLDRVLAMDEVGGDAGAGHVGTSRIENEDRDILHDRGHDGGRVQHLGAEVGEFGGFRE